MTTETTGNNKGFSDSMMLSVSILLSTLILSGTLFWVGSELSNSLTGLEIATTGNSGNTGGTVQTAPSQNPSQAPSQNPASPPQGGTVKMADLLAGASGTDGDPNAPVIIVEFSDFECPFCGRFHDDSGLQIRENYVKTGKVQLVYKDFPLSFHPSAQPSAEAARCAAEQGKFWEMHDKLFENQQALSDSDLKGYAVGIGLNAEQFNSCFDSGKYTSAVEANFSEGSRVGVSGTPSFFIGKRDGTGQIIVGAQPYSNFKSIIDGLLQ
ncbi:MAG: DsbA family protein [Candidatus Diapherotrites archaeon]|nr:DsbA family protein [Candidatus Diapherotrites archaeon]